MELRTSLAVPLALGALLVAGCAGGPEPTGSADDTTSESPEAETDGQDPGDDREGQGGEPRVLGDPATCELVRAGIDAFNTGDFEATVEEFSDAVPLAEEAAADDDSRASRDLLDAVRYYADLAPDDYPEAAVRSRDFLRFKQITLLQCDSAGAPGGEESDPPGVLT